jgi:hypothetical protein
MAFTKDDTYKYSVIDVAQALHYSYSESGDLLSLDKLKELVDWLSWRIHDGWEEHKNGKFIQYEWAVKELASRALDEGIKDLVRFEMEIVEEQMRNSMEGING